MPAFPSQSPSFSLLTLDSRQVKIASLTSTTKMTEVERMTNALFEEGAKSSIEEVRAALRNLGISGYAADVLCALIRLPEATAGELVVKTGIPDSKIYYALEELANHGLVDTQGGKPKVYRVAPLEEVEIRLREIVENKHHRERTEVTRALSLLEPLRVAATASTGSLAYVIKGLTNVMARAQKMISSSRREIVLIVPEEALFRKLEEHLASATRRHVKVRIAAPNPDIKKAVSGSAEVRIVVSSFFLLIVDGQQMLTVRRLPDGSAHGIVSTDETLIRLGLDYWNNPKCCIRNTP